MEDFSYEAVDDEAFDDYVDDVLAGEELELDDSAVTNEDVTIQLGEPEDIPELYQITDAVHGMYVLRETDIDLKRELLPMPTSRAVAPMVELLVLSLHQMAALWLFDEDENGAPEWKKLIPVVQDDPTTTEKMNLIH